MKNTAQIAAFKLSVLTTLMLCVTANNNASDIEIYKAPEVGDGKARVMLNLDNSTFMANYPSGGQSSGTIYDDFGKGGASTGIDCGGGGSKFLTESETFTSPIDLTRSGLELPRSYTFTANYCQIKANDLNKVNSTAVTKSCTFYPLLNESDGGTYKCYDRFTMLKRAAFRAINSAELGSGITLGLNYFPKHTSPADSSANVQRPIPLAWYKIVSGAAVICDADLTGCTNGRDQLSLVVQGLRISETNYNEKTVPVSLGYGQAVKALLTNPDGSDLTGAVSCSGYGIFNLTSGSPVDDDMGSARTLLNSVLRNESDAQILNTLGQCETGGSGNSASNGVAWQCIATGAERLLAGKTKINQKVRSTVVSFGTNFKLGLSDLNPYNSETTTAQTIRADLVTAAGGENKFKGIYQDKEKAAVSGLVGGAGYYSADDTNAVVDLIVKFAKDIPNVDIPYIITGAPTIPQDPLNPVLVQSDAYYSQFKPTPLINDAAGSRLWAGNMKKYHVTNLGRLVGKDNADVINSIGELIPGTKDFWAPAVSTEDAIRDADETVFGSEKYARMGGVKSQLPLGTSVVDSVTVENRKLLTNRVVTSGVPSEGSSLTRIERKNYDVGGSAEGDPKAADIKKLLDLRQIGAVMHSSPLLLSNEGKMTYNATTKKLESSNREDYVLFGTTQGLLHVIKADDYTSTNGGGKEVFAFVPNEMVDSQSGAFQLPEATTGGKANLFYGIDAPWTAYTEYVPKADGTLTVGRGKTTTGTTTLKGKQFVYGGLRMGGRSYYSLDLTDMSSPSLKFHINPDAAASGTPLSYMGESWSKPKIAWVNWQGSRKMVMFVGGGYDAGGTTGKANNGGYESDTYDQTNGIGAGVYMFSADGDDAGDLLWWASNNVSATTSPTTNSGIIALKDSNMKYSVVSEIKTADRNNDGLVDHLYFGDLGGQVFRIDLNNAATTSGEFATRSTRIMNMHAAAGASPRFYSAPSFAIFEDSASGNLFAGISIGSGNLSHPLAGYDSGRHYDALYTIYDKDVTRSDLYTASTMNTQDAAVGATGSLAINELTMANRFQQTEDNMTALVAPYATSSGWYYKLLGGTKIQHEKIFYSPTVIDYDLYVSSYDASRLGLTGACGGGVQGVSKVQIFCMPFGQCSAADYPSRTNTNYSDDHGPGIQNHAIASGGDGTTRLVGGAIIGNNLTDTYATKVKLIAQRWYER